MPTRSPQICRSVIYARTLSHDYVLDKVCIFTGCISDGSSCVYIADMSTLLIHTNRAYSREIKTNSGLPTL